MINQKWYNPSSNDKYPNAFFLRIDGKSTQWRFAIAGSDPDKSDRILFNTNEALKGWKLFSIRWDSTERILKVDIDAGKVFQDKRKIEADHWPQYDSDHLFHLGGWDNSWPAGLSLLEFYNFRIYDIRLFRDDLNRIYKEEGELLRKT